MHQKLSYLVRLPICNAYINYTYTANLTCTNILQIKTDVHYCTSVQHMSHFQSLGGSTALFCVKWRHGRRTEIMVSNQKYLSANWCIFMWRTFLPNFIPIQIKNDGALGLFVKWHNGHGYHLEIMTSYQKSTEKDSIGRSVFTCRTVMPNFTLIHFEMMRP